MQSSLPTTDSFIRYPIYTNLGFSDPLEFQNYIDAVGIEHHPRLSIGSGLNGKSGSALLFDIIGYDFENNTEPVELLRIPEAATIDMDTFMTQIEAQKKYESSFFERNSSWIKPFNKKLRAGEIKFPFIETKHFVNKILLMTMGGASEGRILEAIVLSLVAIKNYSTYFQQVTKHKVPSAQRRKVSNYFEYMPILRQYGVYLQILLNTEVPTFENIQSYPENVLYEDEDSDDHDSLYQALLQYRNYNKKIADTLETTLKDRYVTYDTTRESIKTGFEMSDLCYGDVKLKDVENTILSLKQYHQCQSALRSRILDIPVAELLDTAHFKQGENLKTNMPGPMFSLSSRTLVPVLDFANHSNFELSCNAYFDVDRETSDVLLMLDNKHNKIGKYIKLTGQSLEIEICISYHQENDISMFYANYGFFPIYDNHDYRNAIRKYGNSRTPFIKQNRALYEISLKHITMETYPELFKISANEKDKDLLPEDFHEYCLWLHHLPTMQLIMTYETGKNKCCDFPEVASLKINLSSKNDCSFAKDDFLTLFRDDIVKVKSTGKLNESITDAQKAELAKHFDFLEYNKDEWYVEVEQVEQNDNNKPETSKIFPSNIPELRNALNQASNTNTQAANVHALQNFKNFLTKKYIPARMEDLMSLTRKLSSYEKPSEQVTNFIIFELHLLPAVQKFIQASRDDLVFEIDDGWYENEWRDCRVDPVENDQGEDDEDTYDDGFAYEDEDGQYDDDFDYRYNNDDDYNENNDDDDDDDNNNNDNNALSSEDFGRLLLETYAESAQYTQSRQTGQSGSRQLASNNNAAAAISNNSNNVGSHSNANGNDGGEEVDYGQALDDDEQDYGQAYSDTEDYDDTEAFERSVEELSNLAREGGPEAQYHILQQFARMGLGGGNVF